MNYKKIFLGIVIFGFLFTNVGVAKAVDNSATIQQLIAQIASLQAQLIRLQAQQGVNPTWCHTFNINLGIGSFGSDFDALIMVLDKENISEFNFTNRPTQYDEIIAGAVSALQQKYASEILTPNGLRYPTGYVGRSTRAKLNALYGCGITNPPAPSWIKITSSEKTSSLTPTIYGTTNNLTQVGIVLASSSGDKAYGSGLIPVINGTWSVTVSPAITNGYYTVYVYDANNNKLATGYLNVDSSASATPSISSATPQPVQVGSSLTVYFSNGGNTGSVILKTLDGLKSWHIPYTTGTVYSGFTYYDGNKITLTVPSMIGRGQLPENSGYEAPIPVASGTYNLFVYSIYTFGASYVSGSSVTKTATSHAFPITINTQPSINIVSPNSAKPCYVSDYCNIIWTSSGIGSYPIQVDLLNSSGIYIKTIVANLSNAGSYLWLIDPTISTGNYMVSVATQTPEWALDSALGKSGVFTVINSNR